MKDQAAKLREMVLHLREHQEEKKKGLKIITITSGKGGVGKSNITANLALCLQSMGNRVLILDADFGLSNIDLMLGTTPKYNFSHIINESKRLVDIISEGPGGIKFISGGSGISELVHLNTEQLNFALQDLPQLEDVFDYLLIDTGAGVTDVIIKFILSSHEVIFVTTPEPTSIMDAYALLKNVCAEPHDRLKFWVLVNKAESGKEAQTVLDHFAEIAKRFLKIEVGKLGYIEFDQQVPKSVKLQTPLIMQYPHTTASKAIRKIAESLLDQSPQVQPGNSLAKLFKRFSAIWNIREGGLAK